MVTILGLMFILCTACQKIQTQDKLYDASVKKAPVTNPSMARWSELMKPITITILRTEDMLLLQRYWLKDGYRVEANKKPFSKSSLSGCDILVISNALHKSSLRNWTNPVPSAFSKTEIAALKEWVEAGGALFLIADHMPFPGAAADLAEAFDFTFFNGFAFDTTQNIPTIFRRKENSLRMHEITLGNLRDSKIDSVMTFTGQAFKYPKKATPLLVFDHRYKIFMPDTAWAFQPQTPREPIPGWAQGAVMEVGKGRVAMFGEAAMFTAQIAGIDRKLIGMNAFGAPQNKQFLLNIMHWLGKRKS